MDDTNRTSTHSSPGAYRFGLFTLNASAGSLTRNGLRVKLQDQPFQLLALLLERSGEIVTREEIRLRLWQRNTFVDFDKSLGVAILKVREALGDSASNPTFLETLPRRGYRFIAPVSVEAAKSSSTLAASVAQTDAPLSESVSSQPGTSPSEVTPSAETQFQKARGRTLWLAVATVCSVVIIAFVIFRLLSGPHYGAPSAQETPVPLKVRRSVAVLGFRNVAREASQNWLSSA